jgi:hypothetical protein
MMTAHVKLDDRLSILRERSTQKMGPLDDQRFAEFAIESSKEAGRDQAFPWR